MFLPYDYPPNWTHPAKAEQHSAVRQYTEQYLLAALLYGNTDWKVILSANLLKNKADFSGTVLDHPEGGSIWLQKTGEPSALPGMHPF